MSQRTFIRSSAGRSARSQMNLQKVSFNFTTIDFPGAASPALLDPFALALRYATAPYARGTATLELALGPPNAGASEILPYNFYTFQTKYGVQANDIGASYLLTLRVDQLSGPAVVDVDYIGSFGTGTLHLVIPEGSLVGTSFVLAPLPSDPGLQLKKLTEHPIPGAGEPSGPNKWALKALLGNAARLLGVLAGESQVLAGTVRDVKSQFHLQTARGASLDRIGQGRGVPRLLAAPYRLDLDQDTIALYHLDDPIAPVIDATHNYHGLNIGAKRGITGKFGGACQITPDGGVVIPDALAFAIDPAVGFTVELFVNLAAPPGPQEMTVFAGKRPRFDQTHSPGWSLALEPSAGGHDLAFTLTDSAGAVIRAAAANVVLPIGTWFHLAGVVNSTTKEAAVFLNGQLFGNAPLGALRVVETCANVGLGADFDGVSHLNGSIDEVRFSDTGRTDFSHVLGPSAQPYPVDGQTVALYHFDETDDWIDEDRGAHFALNFGAQRGIPARFGDGLRFMGDPLPQARCLSERKFQNKLRAGSWDRTAGGALIPIGSYARFGYRQGAIVERGLDGDLHPVSVNDRGLLTTACYGFMPDDPTNTNDPSQTIARFQVAGRSVQEAIDYFGEWHGLDSSFFAAQYQAHGITASHETCLPTAWAPTSVLIPGAAEFAFNAATSFTVEAFIKPDPVVDDYARAVIASRSSALLANESNANEAGWALCLGPYHSIPNNLRWVLGDATGTLLAVDADINLADGVFHHVAGVVDRDVGVARLYVDGVEVRQTPLGNLDAPANNGPIIMGNCPKLNAPYAGLLDEVRISRAARRRFEPVLGESDTRYRQRLAIYQPWRLPVYPTIKHAVQALTLASSNTDVDVVSLLLGNEPPPNKLIQFDVDETDSTRFCGSQWLRIIPKRLAPEQSIAADGTSPANEPSVAGVRALLPDDPALTPGLNGRLMVLATAQALEQLAARLAVLAPGARLSVQSAFVPLPSPNGQPPPMSNDNLGRALTVTLDPSAPGLDLGVLGALAFEMGIAYVAYLDGNLPLLRLIVAPGEDLELVVIGPSTPGRDLENRQIAILQQPLTIAINRPKPKTISGLAPQLEWSVLPCGPAAGTLSTAGSDPSQIIFTGTAPGRATITVRYALPDGVTILVGSLPIMIAPQALDGCDILGGDGTANVTEAASSGLPDPDFRTDYLVTAADARVHFAQATPPAASNLMQLPLETALTRLATLAAREPGAPRITVLAAFDPNGTSLQAVGRGMVIAPSSTNLTAGRLGALAFLAGFSYIERRRYPPSVYVSVPQGNRFEIVSGPLKRLWPNARISGQGELMASEFDAAGPPDPNFNQNMLQHFTDPRAAFAAGINNEVQPSLASTLTALLNALATDSVSGVLQVIGGFVPQDPTLLGVGRAVLARHPSLPADRLSGYALQAGFGFVQHRTLDPGGPAVYMAAYPAAGVPLNLLPNTGTDSNYVNVYLNTLTELSVRPQLAVKGQLDWCIQASCPASAVLSTSLPEPRDKPGITEKVFEGTAAGAVAAVATFSLRDFSEPYQFRVLPCNGPAQEPQLTKDQYDDLLNFLDTYHPIGTEAVTRELRQFVHGFKRPPRWDRLPTAATFPHYRVNH